MSYWLVILRKPFVNAEGSGKGRGSERKGLKEWKGGKRPFLTEDELLVFWKPAPSFAGTVTWSGMCASASVVQMQSLMPGLALNSFPPPALPWKRWSTAEPIWEWPSFKGTALLLFCHYLQSHPLPFSVFPDVTARRKVLSRNRQKHSESFRSGLMRWCKDT